MRTTFIAGNWKMNLNGAQAASWVDSVARAATDLPPCDLAVFPSFPHLALALERARAGRLAIGAQNCHHEDRGAFTGEVAAAQLADLGVRWVVLGHSERRRDCAEDDARVAAKLAAARRSGLGAIVCVGETLEQRDAGNTIDVVTRQVAGSLAGRQASEFGSAVAIAYEPVWAIGTGRTATPSQAAEVHAAIRAALSARFGGTAAAAARILYGGSVTPQNAASLLMEAEIDGALIGGASLEAGSFLEIARAAPARG
jgi:triosephosphate isomerase